MAKRTLTGKIFNYLRRAKEEKRLYPLEEVGLFKIVGGSYDGQRSVFPELCEGRFIDVLKFALEQDEFYDEKLGKYSSAGDSRNGYVVKADQNDFNKFERTRTIEESKKEKIRK